MTCKACEPVCTGDDTTASPARHFQPVRLPLSKPGLLTRLLPVGGVVVGAAVGVVLGVDVGLGKGVGVGAFDFVGTGVGVGVVVVPLVKDFNALIKE